MLFACNMKEALDVTKSVTAGLSVANEIPRTLIFTHIHRDRVAVG